jgi:ATPase subunit of ABC transporter with duplicated ATPase domains
LGGYALESQAGEVLHGLGFKDDQIDGDVGALSGGWKMRLALARVPLGTVNVGTISIFLFTSVPV